MHSCKTTKDLMTELLSGGTSPPTHELLIELRCCRECRHEFEALISPELKQLAGDQNIELIRYQDL